MTSRPTPEKTGEPSSLTDLIAAYEDYYAAGSSHTARAKRYDLEAFLSFLVREKKASGPEDLSLRDWDASSTQAFIENRLTRGEAPATVSRRLATLKHMGRTLAERLPDFINPAREVKPPKVQLLKPKSLDPVEVETVLARAESRVAERKTFSRARNEALIHVMLDTGLRADEVRNLRRGQLDDSCEWLERVRTKGRRFRKVYLTTQLRPRVLEYLALRAEELKRFFPAMHYQIDAKLPLFISSYGAQPADPDSFLMSPKSIWRAVREVSGETKLHPHLLRHTFAVELLESSHDVRLVAQALGHSDVRTTMRYTERLDEEMARALEKSRRGG